VLAGETIASARLAAGLSQAELAARSGVAQPNISAYESGVRRPSARMMHRLISAARPRPADVLKAHRDEVLALARSNKAERVRVFGSVATGRDTATSDIDLLVLFRDGASLLDQANLTMELTELLGVRVDVISEGGLSARHDDIVRQAIAL